MKLSDAQIIKAANNIAVEPDTRDGFREVTPGVYLFTGADMTHRHKRTYQWYAIALGGNIRIEKYRCPVL